MGAIVTQASTNPRLGHLGLNLLRAGYSALRVLEEIAAKAYFPLVSYYNLRPRDPNMPPAAEWLAAQRRQ